MKKVIAFTLCILLCLGLAPVSLANGGGGDSIPFNQIVPQQNGDYQEYKITNGGVYIISSEFNITSGESIRIESGTLTIASGGSLTIQPNGRFEIMPESGKTGTLVNNGTFKIEGQAEVNGSEGGAATIENTGEIEVKGRMSFNGDAILDSNGDIKIEANSELRFENNSVLNNDNVSSLTVNEEGQLNFDNAVLNNHGQMEVNSHSIGFNNAAVLYNYYQININNGKTNFDNGGKLENTTNGAISVKGSMRFSSGAAIVNLATVGKISGEGDGKIELENITLDDNNIFYENVESPSPITGSVGEHQVFQYDEVSNRWVLERDNNGNENGNGNGQGHEPQAPENITIKVKVTGEGTVMIGEDGAEIQPGTTLGPAEVWNDKNIIIQLEPGNRISKAEALVDGIEKYKDDHSWNLEYKGSGRYIFPLERYRADDYDEYFEIRFEFKPIVKKDLDEMFKQYYVILTSEAAISFPEYLDRQIGASGNYVGVDVITTSGYKKNYDVNDGYGTFEYTVTVGTTTTPVQTGYVVEKINDVICKINPEGETSEIYVAKDVPEVDPVSSESQEISVPAVHEGTMEIFGYGNLLGYPLSDFKTDKDGKLLLPFYVAQFHVNSFYSGFSSFGLYVIQEDALCVEVAARRGDGGEAEVQRTYDWDLNRYADLTKGDYTIDVFFGNDNFILKSPESQVGGIASIGLVDKNYGGYEVIDNKDGTYTVKFISNYYDDISLNLTLELKSKNGVSDVDRTLKIRRVGVHIADFELRNSEEAAFVNHATQYASEIFYADGKYQIFATYYIPGYGEDIKVPKLFVTYTWKNGSVTTEIIDRPCMTPAPMIDQEIFDYERGIFEYTDGGNRNMAAACDFLLWGGNKASAPVEVNVIVLDSDIESGDTFGGVTLGSGKGVTWKK